MSTLCHRVSSAHPAVRSVFSGIPSKRLARATRSGWASGSRGSSEGDGEARIAWHPIDLAACCVRPACSDMPDPQTAAAIAAREVTISELRKRLCRIARELTDEEVVKLVDAMVRAPARPNPAPARPSLKPVRRRCRSRRRVVATRGSRGLVRRVAVGSPLPIQPEAPGAAPGSSSLPQRSRGRTRSAPGLLRYRRDGAVEAPHAATCGGQGGRDHCPCPVSWPTEARRGSVSLYLRPQKRVKDVVGSPRATSIADLGARPPDQLAGNVVAWRVAEYSWAD